MKVALLATALTATLALTACGADSPSAPDSSSPAATPSASAGGDAMAEFKTAIAKSGGLTSTFTITSDLGSMGGSTGDGATDPTGKTSRYHAVITVGSNQLTVDTIQVGTDLYLKMPGALPGVDPGKWSHVDTTKVKSLAKLGLNTDGAPANLDLFRNSVVSAEKTGPGTFKGTIDGTQNPALGANAATLGDAIKSIPFEAATDGEGNVTSLTNHTPAVGTVPATTTTIKFADYGKPVSIAKPAASETQEIPADFYTALN